MCHYSLGYNLVWFIYRTTKYKTKAPSVVIVRRHDNLEPFTTVTKFTNKEQLVEDVSRTSHAAFVSSPINVYSSTKKTFTLSHKIQFNSIPFSKVPFFIQE